MKAIQPTSPIETRQTRSHECKMLFLFLLRSILGKGRSENGQPFSFLGAAAPQTPRYTRGELPYIGNSTPQTYGRGHRRTVCSVQRWSFARGLWPRAKLQLRTMFTPSVPKKPCNFEAVETLKLCNVESVMCLRLYDFEVKQVVAMNVEVSA